MDFAALLSEARRLGWDIPYRLIASLLGLASLVAIGSPSIARPSDAFERITSWLGLNIATAADGVARWFIARAEVIAPVSGFLLLAGLLAIIARGPGFRPGGTKAPATCWICIAGYLEARGHVGLSRVLPVVFFCTVMAMPFVVFQPEMFVSDRFWSGVREALGSVAVELVAAALFAAYLPASWAVAENPRRGTSEQEDDQLGASSAAA
jgi:hypothetical protein